MDNQVTMGMTWKTQLPSVIVILGGTGDNLTQLLALENWDVIPIEVRWFAQSGIEM